MAAEAIIRADACQLRLRIESYSHPDMTTGTDANWLSSLIELEVGTTGSYTARQRADVRTTDIARFTDELRQLDERLTGEASLELIEGELRAKIRLTARKGELSGHVREHVGAELRFDRVDIDQTYVRAALSQFNNLIAAFPVRGNPYE